MGDVWVVGEALIDLVPGPSGAVERIVGGGPANTAKALAGFGFETSFVGGISSDEFGGSIWAELSGAGVDLSLVKFSDLPTATAKVSLDLDGKASYDFNLEGTATFAFSRDWLPRREPEVIHIGTLATIVEPGASELLEWIQGFSAPIVFDPNVRVSVLSDVGRYRELVERWVNISSVVKVSEEDISFLFGDRDFISVAREWISNGVELVVITRGANGLVGITSESVVEVTGVPVDVVDTIGAGDTVGAIVVEAIIEQGLAAFESERLTLVLERAARAASITCSRVGAKPPTRDEL
jgi:fructokinase